MHVQSVPPSPPSSVDAPAQNHVDPAKLTVEDVSELLAISVRAAYRAAERGQIPSFRIGRRVYVATRPFLEMIGVASLQEARAAAAARPST